VPPLLYIDEEWLALRTEDVIDPNQPIVDAHHHLWERQGGYLSDDLLRDINDSGHLVRGTVFVECSSMYRAEGDPRFASIGEVEYANGVGAAFASGFYGSLRACAGIVGHVDLTLGAFAEEVMQACIARAPDRLRGIRHMAGWDASPEVSLLKRPPPKDLFLDRRFRGGFAKLAPLGLSFDGQCYHPQLPQLIDLIDAFPDTRVIVNHFGGLARVGPYASKPDEVFREWKLSIEQLAKRPTTFMKIGGIGMRLKGFDFLDRDLPPTSVEMAEAYKPFVETCIEAFGPSRTMFESNFPVDKAGCTYRVLWNSYKRIAAGCSKSEKADLFAGTAIRAYRLPEALGQPSKAGAGQLRYAGGRQETSSVKKPRPI
jgi:predicted TIM-barrel fold metal-dependent hydrolase